MSCKVMYTCDHCGKEVSPYLGKQWRVTLFTVGPNMDDVHACSKEHLGIALAKAFGIGINGEADELLNRKQQELTKLADANNFLILERDNMRDRLAELEARMPANECTNAERAQYETTIELQRKRIEELRISEAVSIERLARVEEPAKRLVDIDNELAEGRDAAAKASFHDAVMRPIEELRVYFGNIARTEKRGQTLFDWEVERRKRAERGRDELQDRVAELEKRIASASKTEQIADLNNLSEKLVPIFEQTDDALFDLYMEHVKFFDMNGTMTERNNMIETLAVIECDEPLPDTSTESGLPDTVLASITLPTKPTKPLREDDQ